MKNNTALYSVVVPVFNSQDTIHELVSRISGSFRTWGLNCEIILVNDGSTDNSWSAIEGAKKEFPGQLKAVNFTRNYGQHNAILCGLGFCSGDFVITIDDDLQHPPEEIIKLIEKQQETGSSVVYGMYENKQHSALRNFASAFIRKTSDFKAKNQGGGSSFRLLEKQLTDQILQQHRNNFMFLDSILNWYTGNIALVQVQHHARKTGRSGYTMKKLVFIYLNILYHYSTKPLKIITFGGLFFSVISFLFGLRFIYKKFVYNVPLGYTSIIVSIMFSTSLILFCLGIIGNYLYKLYQLQQNKPPYSIQKII
jgi:polyisoprenyl-phosphate glycosyltransferase